MLLSSALTLIASPVLAAAAGANLGRSAPTYYPVNWSLSPNCTCKDCPWIKPSDHVTQCTGITRYKLCEQSKPRIYQYSVKVDVEHGWCRTFLGTEFYFDDSEPDEYKVSCRRKGEHSVDYNSEDPNITRVGIKHAMKKCNN